MAGKRRAERTAEAEREMVHLWRQRPEDQRQQRDTEPFITRLQSERADLVFLVGGSGALFYQRVMALIRGSITHSE